MTHNTTRPHVKWGSLIFTCIGILTEVILIALNFFANTGSMATDADLAIGLIAGYGWLFGVFALLGGIGVFFEEFLPSYRTMKKWEKQNNQRRAALRAQQKAEQELYDELLAQWG